MPFCPQCGTQVADNAQFCPQCGQGQRAAPPAPGNAPGAAAGSGLQENVAALLSYLLGWVTGLIFLLIDKRPFVRFHAAQSIVVFGGLNILQIGLSILLGLSFLLMPGGFSLAWYTNRLLGLAGLLLWVFLMVKASQGERTRIPVAADLADKLAGS